MKKTDTQVVICPFCPEMNKVEGSDKNGWHELYKCPECGGMMRVTKAGKVIEKWRRNEVK